jgi:hypothetical protein
MFRVLELNFYRKLSPQKIAEDALSFKINMHSALLKILFKFLADIDVLRFISFFIRLLNYLFPQLQRIFTRLKQTINSQLKFAPLCSEDRDLYPSSGHLYNLLLSPYGLWLGCIFIN